MSTRSSRNSLLFASKNLATLLIRRDGYRVEFALCSRHQPPIPKDKCLPYLRVEYKRQVYLPEEKALRQRVVAQFHLTR